VTLKVTQGHRKWCYLIGHYFLLVLCNNIVISFETLPYLQCMQ